MAPPRVKWNPAQHPRNPIGRFVSVDSQFRDRGWDGYKTPGAAEDPQVSAAYGRGLFRSFKEYSPDQVERLAEYQVGMTPNKGLRDPRFMGESARRRVQALDPIVDQNRLADDTVVYRGMSMDQVQELAPGDQMIDPAFMSTSLGVLTPARFASHHQHGPGGAIMEIELPAGTGAAIFELNPSQSEVLIGRGAVLEVVSRDHDRLTTRLVGYVDD